MQWFTFVSQVPGGYPPPQTHVRGGIFSDPQRPSLNVIQSRYIGSRCFRESATSHSHRKLPADAINHCLVNHAVAKYHIQPKTLVFRHHEYPIQGNLWAKRVHSQCFVCFPQQALVCGLSRAPKAHEKSFRFGEAFCCFCPNNMHVVVNNLPKPPAVRYN